MDSGFLRFITAFLALWGLLHLYVFWRIARLPWVMETIPGWTMALAGVALWASYVVARVLDARGHETAAKVLEPLAVTWIGLFFLLFSLLLAVDLMTLGGLLGASHVFTLRSIAVISAIIMALAGIFIATRAPTVRDTAVSLPGLSSEHDGLSLVLISDLHLGSLLGAHWLEKLIAQVNALKPDIIAIAGDLADHDYARVEAMLPQLSQLQAPLGVWAVTGNHDAYAGLERMHALMRTAGFHVLSDASAEVLPGLIMAGVDDLSVPRRMNENATNAIPRVLEKTPSGAVILLSHTPHGVELAAQAGASLMLSGHTHGGQIWPFNLLVRTRFNHVGGVYSVGKMTLIVCRGTGTWGPRMRLWRPSELWNIRLRAPSEDPTGQTPPEFSR